MEYYKSYQRPSQQQQHQDHFDGRFGPPAAAPAASYRPPPYRPPYQPPSPQQPASPFALSSSSSNASAAMSLTHSNVANHSSCNSNTTNCSSYFLQTTHAQIRRQQRNILYKDVKAAIKYGIRQPHIWSNDLKRYKQQRQQKGKLSGGRLVRRRQLPAARPPRRQQSIYKYTYKDIIYIVNEKERKEITCYTKPIELVPIPIPIPIPTAKMSMVSHKSSRSEAVVGSHTVMIIDTSGSMKNSDVFGTRNRLDAVWMAIAIDFIAVRLQEQELQQQQQQQQLHSSSTPASSSSSKGTNDVVTIILMKEQAQVLYRCVPITWVLYNQFIHIYNQKQTIPPCGHGCYIPSLAIAEQIIDECYTIDQNTYNFNDSTVTTLLFLSDGVPSDSRKNQHHIMEHIQSITTKQVQMNSPFLFIAIGIGDGNDSSNNRSNIGTGTVGGEGVTNNKYPLLHQMVETAKNSGATCAQLKVPSMSCTSFGQTFSSVATSISTSMTLESTTSELLLSQQQRGNNIIQGGFRTVTLRTGGDDDDDDDNTDNHNHNNPYHAVTDQHWCSKIPRESKIKAMEHIHEVTDEDFFIFPCSNRIVCNVQDDLSIESSTFISAPCQHPATKYVAIAKGAFDEGSERYVYRFYEIADDRKTIVGIPMVAKESRRMVHSNTTSKTSTNVDGDDDFVYTCCKAQQIARRLAIEFNRRLYGNSQQIPINTPRISFLDCCIYETYNPFCSRQQRKRFLVENMVDHTKWCKWNSNNGWRRQTTTSHVNHIGHPSLEQINEGDDEDMSDDDENENTTYSNMTNVNLLSNQSSRHTTFSVSQVAQAFSHFTHWKTNGEYLVCDLQGIYNVERNTLQLTDPVIHSDTTTTINNNNIHHRKTHRFNVKTTNLFGRTDRGCRGIDDFFMTHRCNDQDQLCQLVTGCHFHSVLSSYE